jgi:hypothetical protein
MLHVSFCMYILLPILKLPIGMLNKEHTTPTHPVSLYLYLCLKIKKGISSNIIESHQQHSSSIKSHHQQQHHQIRSSSSIKSHPHRISSSIESASAYHQQQHRIESNRISIKSTLYHQQQHWIASEVAAAAALNHISSNTIESAAAIHDGFPICKQIYQWPQQTSKWRTIGTPPNTNHGPYKHMTLGQPKFQHHTNTYYNNTTTATTNLDLGHPAVKHRFCQRCILLLKAPKTRATPQADNPWTTPATWYRRLKLWKESFGPSRKMVTCLLQSVPLQI